MNMEFIQQRIKGITKIPNFESNTDYVIIYPTIGKFKFCNRSEMIAELGILKDCDITHMEIILVNKHMSIESAMHIARQFDLEYEVMYDITSNDMTPYQALQEWDII